MCTPQIQTKIKARRQLAEEEAGARADGPECEPTPNVQCRDLRFVLDL